MPSGFISTRTPGAIPGFLINLIDSYPKIVSAVERQPGRPYLQLYKLILKNNGSLFYSSGRIQDLFNRFWNRFELKVEDHIILDKCFKFEKKPVQFTLHQFKNKQPSLKNFLQTEFMAIEYDETSIYNQSIHNKNGWNVILPSKCLSKLKQILTWNYEYTFCCYLWDRGRRLTVILRFDKPIVGVAEYILLYNHYINIINSKLRLKSTSTSETALTCSLGYDEEILIYEGSRELTTDIDDVNERLQIIKDVKEVLLYSKSSTRRKQLFKQTERKC